MIETITKTKKLKYDNVQIKQGFFYSELAFKNEKDLEELKNYLRTKSSK